MTAVVGDVPGDVVLVVFCLECAESVRETNLGLCGPITGGKEAKCSGSRRKVPLRDINFFFWLRFDFFFFFNYFFVICKLRFAIDVCRLALLKIDGVCWCSGARPVRLFVGVQGVVALCYDVLMGHMI